MEATRKKCLWENVNFISRLFHLWILPVLFQGNERELDEKDLCSCSEDFKSETLGTNLEKEWEKELAKRSKGKNPNLFLAILRANKMYLALYLFIGTFQNCVIRTIQPLLVGVMVDYFLNPDPTQFSKVVGSACGLFVTASAYSFFGNQCFSGGGLTGLRIKSACSFLLYKKSVRLGVGALGETTVGQIVNLLSNNFNRFEVTARFLPFLLAAPFQLIVTCLILRHYLGVTTLAGFGMFMFQIVFQLCVGQMISKVRARTAEYTDERVRLVNESMIAMKVIKMYTWEKPLWQQVDEARKTEISKRLLGVTLMGLASDMAHLSGKLATFATIVAFFLVTRQHLNPQLLFVTMAFFENLRLSLRLFVFSVTFGADSFSAILRFQRFLQLEEKEAITFQKEPCPSSPAVSFSGATAKWFSDQTNNTFENVSLSIERGELVAVVGPVGAGKTSVLLALLGELPLSRGKLGVWGKMVYVPQEPWLFSGSVRDNILVFSDADHEKYAKVLMTTTLNKDIARMKYADKTLAGERGTQLSGGQKARVNLARAVCIDADIYLLDDPLSAVDASVGKHIFHKCINGYLKGKTRILVTHHVQFIKAADRILVLNAGQMMAFGTYSELVNRGIDFSYLCKKVRDQPTEMGSGHSLRKGSSLTDLHYHAETRTLSIDGQRRRSLEELSTYLMEQADISAPQQDAETTQGITNMTSKACWNYWKAGGGIPAILFIVTLVVCAQCVYNMIDIFLSFWSSEGNGCIVSDNTTKTHEQPVCFPFLTNDESYLDAYVVLMSLLVLLWVTRSASFYVISNRVSSYLHKKVMKSLFSAPVAFFDQNPAGRILNRVTKDMGNIDDVLPGILCEWLTVTVLQIGYIVVVIIYIPWISVVAFIAIILGVGMGKFYIKPGRNMQRLDSTTSSPVYSHLSNTIAGLHVIRAFHGEERFTRQFAALQDVQTAASCYTITAGALFRTCIEICCVIFFAFVEVFLLVSPGVDAHTSGLTLSSCLQMSLAVQYIALLAVQVISLMVSVERVVEYKMLPGEIRQDKKPPPKWPNKGAILFENVSLKYGPTMSPSLKSLNFAINPTEKIGIVGRTGAGKSSIIAALLRLHEPEGNMYIDGISTKEIDIYELRNRISVIPQDPVLFSGPLRKSIDPFKRYPDFKLWSALKQVQLDLLIHEFPKGLDTILSDGGGGTFSVGQRQLICMARAIVVKAKILVLDEATANIDPRTDAIIQNAIRENFRNCTLLTVAHRLETIIDCDKLMVLESGRIMEFDEPHILLQKKDGFFSKLAQETGPSTLRHLQEKAAAAFVNRHAKSVEGTAGGKNALFDYTLHL